MAAKDIAFCKTQLDAVLKNGTPFLALFTTDGGSPTNAAAGTESALARTALTYGAATGTTTGSATTSASATSAAPGSDLPEVSWWAIYDASTNGNRKYWGALATPITPKNGVPLVFPASSFTCTEA